MIDDNGRPVAVGRDYDRAEIAADAVIHGVGLILGAVGVAVLIMFAARSPANGELPVAVVYAAGLLAMLGFSAAYNLWPASRVKWLLRRFDHSAIYLLIAATYTPFILEVKDSVFALALLVCVWCVAILGIVLKLRYPGRFDRVAVGIYLAMGWSGVMLYDAVVKALPALVLE